jgi:hypothetical protein
MATSSSQVGVKKKRKAQRPLIAPALPLNLKSKSTRTSEPATTQSPNFDFANNPEPGDVAEETKEVALPIQELEETPVTDSSPGSVLKNDTADEPALFEQESRPERHPSSAAPEVLDEYTSPGHENAESTFRSMTPKASSRAAPSSTQSPAPEPAQDESHVNGVALEAFQVTSMSTGGSTNTRPASQVQVQAQTQLTQTAEPSKMIVPQRYVNSGEPIRQWAQEMSEEMPPDTLHIPSVPHLSELSSDSSAAHDADLQAVAHAPELAHPSKPVFSSTFVPELHSDATAEDTPKREASILTNGYSYTPETKLGYAGMTKTPSKPDRIMVPFVNGHIRQTSQTLSEHPMSDISSHLNKLFETREWADWTIQLVSLNASYPPIAYHAHGAVISRSQVLCSHMRSCLHTRAMTTVISLSPPRYVQPAAFEAALKYLYNEKILTTAEAARYFSLDGTITESAMKTYRLDFCFSYWLSGCLLGISPIIEAGLELLYEYIDWDTVELLVKAALDMKSFPSTQRFSKLSNGAMVTPSTPSVVTSPMSARTTETATEQIGMTQEVHSIQIIGVLTDALANGRLRLHLQEFRLYTSPADILRSHLPDVQKHDRPHSALSSIMFGSLPTISLSASNTQSRSLQPVFSFSDPANNDYEYSAAEKALSAILLNVPFKELDELFKGFMRIFAGEDVLHLFDKILSERESRRVNVAHSEWYQSEVAANRRLPQVDLADELVHDGEKSRLVRTGHSSSHWDYDVPK